MANFGYTLNTATLTDGPVSVVAEAVDADGTLLATVSRDLTIDNAIGLTVVGAGRDAVWRDRSSSVSAIASIWLVRRPQSTERVIRWHIESATPLQPILGSRVAIWYERGIVDATRLTRWEVEQEIIPGTVGATRTAHWDGHGSTGRGVTSGWNVRSPLERLPIQNEVDARWDVLERVFISVGAQADAAWITYGVVASGSQRRTRWAIFGAGGIPPSKGGSATLVVGGYPVPWTERSSVSVDTALGERSTARGTIIDLAATQEYAKGEQVRVYHADGTLVFGGITESATMQRITTSERTLSHNLQVKDWHYLADKHRAARGFVDLHAGEIVRRLVDTYLGVEGVTVEGPGDVTTIYEGVFLSEFIVNYARVSEAIDELASLSDYWWRIDENRVLYFQPRGTRVAPWALGRSDIHYQGSNPTQIAHGNPEYRNRQVILGGIEQTDRQTEIRTGNGIRTSFPMRYAVAAPPTVESSTNDGETWTQETVAEEASDESATARWTWERGRRDIITRFSAPATGIMMRFRYTGQYPIVIVEEDEAAIEDRLIVEGGTGVVEDMEVAQYGPSRGLAMAVANARLTRYGVLGKTLQTRTLRPGLAVGQMLTVNLPDRGLDGTEMLITRLGFQFDGRYAWYSVTAVEGPAVSPWKTLGAMVRAPQPIGERVTVGESAASLVIRQVFRTVWSGEDAPPIWAELYPATDLYPALDLYPSPGAGQWIQYMAWETDGVEFGRRPVTRVTMQSEERTETTVFLGPEVANQQITHLAWYGGSTGNVLIERVAWDYTKNRLEALQIDRVDIRETEGV